MKQFDVFFKSGFWSYKHAWSKAGKGFGSFHHIEFRQNIVVSMHLFRYQMLRNWFQFIMCMAKSITYIEKGYHIMSDGVIS